MGRGHASSTALALHITTPAHPAIRNQRHLPPPPHLLTRCPAPPMPPTRPPPQRETMKRHYPEILGATFLSALFSFFSTAFAAKALALNPGGWAVGRMGCGARTSARMGWGRGW